MNIIDFHCDTIYKIAQIKDESLRKNDLSIDIEKMVRAGYLSQFFAAFIDSKEHPNVALRANELISIFKKEMESNSSFVRHALSYDDILKNEKEGIISCFLTIEEGEALQGSVEELQRFYDLGVRLITLTWNYENQLGYPNCVSEFRNKGLKNKGLECIQVMNELGMIIDVSHLSDGGFYDVAKNSKEPFVASHSNARAIKDHSRNLKDDMIKVLSDKGGVMGINFCSSFLGNSPISKVEDMVRHIKHIYNVGGIDVIALGSDFDGISNEVEIKDCSKMNILYSALKKSGFSEDAIDKVFYKNVLRVIKDVM